MNTCTICLRLVAGGERRGDKPSTGTHRDGGYGRDRLRSSLPSSSPGRSFPGWFTSSLSGQSPRSSGFFLRRLRKTFLQPLHQIHDVSGGGGRPDRGGE